MHGALHTNQLSPFSGYVHMCVCVCERERETQKLKSVCVCVSVCEESMTFFGELIYRSKPSTTQPHRGSHVVFFLGGPFIVIIIFFVVVCILATVYADTKCPHGFNYTDITIKRRPPLFVMAEAAPRLQLSLQPIASLDL